MFFQRGRCRRFRASNPEIRTMGLIMMIVGALLALIFVPFTVWLALLGFLLLAVGAFLRFLF